MFLIRISGTSLGTFEEPLKAVEVRGRAGDGAMEGAEQLEERRPRHGVASVL